MFSMNLLHFCVIFSLRLVINEAAQLPTYLTQCRQTGTNINECFRRSANLGIKQIAKGDIYYDIPCMKPLSLTEPIVRKDSDITIVLSNINIHGLEKSKVADFRLDFARGVLNISLIIPEIIATGNYEVSRTLYNIPFWKAGRFNNKFENVKINYTNGFITTNINGDDYYEILYSRAISEVANGSFDFENILNEQSYYDQQIKAFLNSRIQDINSKGKVAVNRQIAEFITSVFTGILSKVPRRDLFRTI